MDANDLLARLLRGMGHGPSPSVGVMNETLIRREPGPEYGVRSLLPQSPETGQNMLAEMLGRGKPQPSAPSASTDRSWPMWSRFLPAPSSAGDNISLAANIIGGPSFRGIRAYHGSPHKFDKFDMSRIGTGEGAQAFGHGLYFAENPRTAEYYRNYISHMGTDWNDPVSVAKYLSDKFGGREAAIANTRIYPQTDRATRDAVDLLRRGDVDLPERKGHMYEVNIRANPEQFLDWDRPLSGQPISDRLRSLGVEGRSGKEIYERAGSVAGNVEPGSAGWNVGAGKKEAAQFLREAGIPGIKYLDQGSRTAGQGSSNYVLFDDSIIDILKRYGLAAGLVPPAALAIPPAAAPEFVQ